MTSTDKIEKSSNSIIQTFKPDNQQLSQLKLNGTTIVSRSEDMYINLNQLCKAGGKDFRKWKENKKTKAFLEALSASVGIPAVELIRYNEGGNGERHNWGHPQVAINVGQWVSAEFDVQVSKWIRKIEDSRITTFKEEFKDFQLTLSDGKNFMVSVRNDGYINATQLCQAGRKKFNDYKRLKQTEAYLQVLEADTGIPVSQLISLNIGQNCQDTWVHRKVGYHLAQWISPHFSVQVSNILDNIFLTGKYETGKEKSNEELESIWKDKISSLENQLKLKDIEKQNEIDISWVTKYDMKPVFYIGFIGIINGKYVYKFGFSDDFKTRRYNHIKIYGKFDIVFVIECERNNVLEKKFKAHPNIKKVRFSYIFCEENRTELIALDESFTIEQIKSIVRKLKINVDDAIDKEMKHKERVMELDNEKIKLENERIKEETRQKEIELFKMREETKQKEIELKMLSIKKPIDVESEDEIEFEIVESDDDEEKMPVIDNKKESENILQNLLKYTYKQLVAQCRNFGLLKRGKGNILRERIKNYLENGFKEGFLRKDVYQYNNKGKLLNHFNTLSEAEEKLNIHSNTLSRSLNKNYTLNNFIFKSSNTILSKEELSEINKIKKISKQRLSKDDFLKINEEYKNGENKENLMNKYKISRSHLNRILKI